MTDARIRYTKKAIKEVFIELLQEKPLKKITVTEICERAEINRATFYKHYADPYDLMQKLEEDIMEEFKVFLKETDTCGLDQTLVKILKTMRDFQDNSIFRNATDGDNAFSVDIGIWCYHSFAESIRLPKDMEEDIRYKQMTYAYIASGISGIINYWFRNDFKEEPEDIAAMMRRLIDATTGGLM